MPGRRSYFSCEGQLTAAQLRRKQRDAKFRTSHSSAHMKFIEVPASIVPEAKAMVRGKALHLSRSLQLGHHTHNGRDASILAEQRGLISDQMRREDQTVYKAANTAKHGKRAWADLSIEDSADVPEAPTWSGCSEPTLSDNSMRICSATGCDPSPDTSPTQGGCVTCVVHEPLQDICVDFSKLKDQVQTLSSTVSQMASSFREVVEQTISARLPDAAEAAIMKLTSTFASIDDFKRYTEATKAFVHEFSIANVQHICDIKTEIANSAAAAASAAVASPIEQYSREFFGKQKSLNTTLEFLSLKLERIEADLATVKTMREDSFLKQGDPVSSDALPAPCPSGPSQDSNFSIGDYVRTHNLRTEHLNSLPGVVVEFNAQTQRYGVRLHGCSGAKAFLQKNLMRYEPIEQETCHACNGLLNLLAFPPCACHPSGESQFQTAAPCSSTRPAALSSAHMPVSPAAVSSNFA